MLFSLFSLVLRLILTSWLYTIKMFYFFSQNEEKKIYKKVKNAPRDELWLYFIYIHYKSGAMCTFLKTMASHKLSFYVLLLLLVFFIVVIVPEKVFITLTFFMTILNILVMSCLSHFSMIYFIDGHVSFNVGRHDFLELGGQYLNLQF